jgi:hypothetical protein
MQVNKSTHKPEGHHALSRIRFMVSLVRPGQCLRSGQEHVPGRCLGLRQACRRPTRRLQRRSCCSQRTPTASTHLRLIGALSWAMCTCVCLTWYGHELSFMHARYFACLLQVYIWNGPNATDMGSQHESTTPVKGCCALWYRCGQTSA